MVPPGPQSDAGQDSSRESPSRWAALSRRSLAKALSTSGEFALPSRHTSCPPHRAPDLAVVQTEAEPDNVLVVL